CMQDTQLPLTF
nr:immunoglobulin light chain junction region [Macaca mulatta]MOX54097.1 immunoglobulin light chain junction region [Macaca mulatta]MOX54650.1 immunoglobulin light chain junction region [Macaca mulatta]MOX54720.1 immunoglobulin light chain junction region [Macaca mulatta]MOX54743.1 immunoglobulin light chain junction region [Macaca mulatta]